MKKTASILLTILLYPAVLLAFCALELFVAAALTICFPLIVVGGAATLGMWGADKLLSFLDNNNISGNLSLNLIVKTCSIIAAAPVVTVGVPIIAVAVSLVLIPTTVCLLSPWSSNKLATRLIDGLTKTFSTAEHHSDERALGDFELSPIAEYGQNINYRMLTPESDDSEVFLSTAPNTTPNTTPNATPNTTPKSSRRSKTSSFFNQYPKTPRNPNTPRKSITPCNHVTPRNVKKNNIKLNSPPSFNSSPRDDNYESPSPPSSTGNFK